MPYYSPHSHIFKSLYDNIFVQIDAVLTVTCDNIVTLNAVIIGDPTGHTFLWTQITGTPVTWLENQDQTTVMFQQTVTRDDKVFRFTLDKGTFIEKNYEILVTAVPTDVIKTTLPRPLVMSSETSNNNTDFTITAFLPVFRLAGSEVLNDTNRSFLVSASELSLGKMPVFNVVKYLNGVSTVEQTVTFDYKGQKIVSGLNTNTSYRLDNYNGGYANEGGYKSLSEMTFLGNPDLAITDADILQSTLTESIAVTSVLEVISRTIVPMEELEILSTEFIDSGAESVVLEVISRTIQTNEESVDSMKTSIVESSGLFTIAEIKAFQYSSLG